MCLVLRHVCTLAFLNFAQSTMYGQLATTFGSFMSFYPCVSKAFVGIDKTSLPQAFFIGLSVGLYQYLVLCAVLAICRRVPMGIGKTPDYKTRLLQPHLGWHPVFLFFVSSIRMVFL